MPVSPERLTELFSRFTEGTLTPEERPELAELSLLAENQRVLEELLKAAWDNSEMVYPVPSSDITEPILEKILGPTTPAKKTRVLPLWLRRLSAAAVLTGALVGSYYIFFIPNSKKTSPQTAIQKTDPAPGGNRATLTLGNGATMILDSESVGTLAQQGNTIISKVDSGRIAYHVEAMNPATVEYNTLRTPRGGQFQIVLPDGTKVWLNAASSITYPSAFTGDTRLVMITGEVYFEVVHNAHQPFSVKVRDRLITDIGTSFNINAYSDEAAITTTVITGSVKMYLGNRTNILSAGQQETASVEGESVTINDHADIGKVMAWQRGQFEFNQTKLPVILRQISRWYDVDIKYEGMQTNEDFGGGISRNLPLSGVQKLLEANGVVFLLDGKTLYVSYHPVK